MTRLADVDSVDDDLLEELEARDTDFLYRVFGAVRQPEEDKNDSGRRYEQDALDPDKWRQKLAGTYPEETRGILDAYDRLRQAGVRVTPAVEYLAGVYDIDAERLEVETRYQLVALLAEEDLTDEIGEIIVGAQIQANAAKRGFILDQPVSLSNLDERLDKFHHKRNVESDADRAVRIETELRTETTTSFNVWAQKRQMKTIQYFPEQDGEVTESTAARPEIAEFTYQGVKQIRFLVSVGEEDGETRLVFTDDLNGWHRLLNTIFADLFDVSDVMGELEHERSEVSEELDEEFVDSIERGDDPVTQLQDMIDSRSETAVDEIEAMDRATSWKENMKELIDTIQISGAEADDAAAIRMREFRLISQGGLDDVFDSVNVEDGVRDIVRSAEDENLAFVLSINGTPIRSKGGRWRRVGPGSLPDDERRALELFFDNDSPL